MKGVLLIELLILHIWMTKTSMIVYLGNYRKLQVILIAWRIKIISPLITMSKFVKITHDLL